MIPLLLALGAHPALAMLLAVLPVIGTTTEISPRDPIGTATQQLELPPPGA